MFDPYRKWLGIQPKDQPPNYYRLISVDLFEDDLDVIEGAADRTMAFVRQYQASEHAEDAARLLNELAAARLCLLKPDKKAAYDASLRKEMAANSPAKSVPKPVVVSTASETASKPSRTSTTSNKKSTETKSAKTNWPVLVIGVIVVVIAVQYVTNARNELTKAHNEQIEEELAPDIETSPVVSKRPKPVITNPAIPAIPKKTEPLPKKPETQTGFILPAPSEIVRAEPPAKIEADPPMEAETPPLLPEPPKIELIRSWEGMLAKHRSGVLSSDGSRLVYVTGNDVIVVDTETGKHEVKLSGHTKTVWTACFTGDDKQIVSVSGDERIRIWDLKSEKTILIIKVKSKERGTILASSRGAAEIAFSASDDRKLTMVNGKTRAEGPQMELTEPQVYWRAISPNMRWGLSNGIRNESTIWNLGNRASFQIDNGHHNYCGYFTDDSAQVLLAGQETWDLWDLQTQKLMKRGSVAGAHIYAAATTNDVDRLLTGLSDGTLWLWDVATTKVLTTIKAHNTALESVFISPDKKLAVSHEVGGIIRVWRLPD